MHLRFPTQYPNATALILFYTTPDTGTDRRRMDYMAPERMIALLDRLMDFPNVTSLAYNRANDAIEELEHRLEGAEQTRQPKQQLSKLIAA